jgi:formylglycine-generating enzyme required for sulfatase activity
MTRTSGLVALAGCAFGAASCALVWGIDEPHPQADDAGGPVDSSVAEAGDGSPVGDAGDARVANDSGDGGASNDWCKASMPDAGARDGSPPSCAPGGIGLTNCGPSQDESCCASERVFGGSFDRGFDKENYGDQSHGATVSDFLLDKYEVTVGRFRQFVQFVVATGWQPCAGSGKHVHLDDGGGLNSGTESGWQGQWPKLSTMAGDWNNSLSQCVGKDTWTQEAGANENLPITCVSWYQLYAFCIWDGGFLPTDAEWNYAAAGGPAQRAFPWSDPSTSYEFDCAHANADKDSGTPCVGRMVAVGSLEAGAGVYSQYDLAGNALEWVLDLYPVDAGYVYPCEDCALLSSTEALNRTWHGGSATRPYLQALVSFRAYNTPTESFADYGGRCARPAY